MYIKQQATIPERAVACLLSLANKTDIRPGPGGSRITSIPSNSTELTELPLKGLKYMFVALYPSAQLVGHTDPPVPNERYHIPLQINNGCWYFHDDSWQQLQIGNIYLMDPTKVHGAVNWGHEVRLHLIIDTD